jgi:cytochrome P450
MLGLAGVPHDRLRRPTARAFSMRRVNALLPFIEATTARLLDRVAGAAEFDLVATLAFLLPAYTVFTLLGVPERDFAQLKQWCENRAELYWGRPSPQAQVEIAVSLAAHRQYLHDLVTVKTHEPGDDLTSDLIAIHREDPERLTLSEISSIVFSLSFAGHETTTGLIGNIMRQLLADRSRWMEIVRRPELIPGAIDEALRYDPSVPVWRRITTKPTVLGGVELPQDAKLFLWLAAAGRDAAVFAAPDRFDMRRPNASQHMTFGKGAHFCPGANLAKLEAQIAVRELARRYPDLRLAPNQHIAFHPNISFRGPLALRLQTGS